MSRSCNRCGTALIDAVESQIALANLRSDPTLPRMPAFALEKKLGSLAVTKDLLKQVEDYVLRQVPIATGLPLEKLQTSIKWSITDSFGTETLNSFTEYAPALFPNSTSEIAFNLHVYHPAKEAKVTLTIVKVLLSDREWSANAISINFEGANAREGVVGVYEGLNRLIEPFRTRNWIYHLGGGVDIAIGCAALVGGLIFFRSSPAHAWYLLGAGAIILVWWLVGRMHPMTTFETRNSKSREKWADWAVKAFATFLVSGVVLTFLRKKLFGF